MNRHSEMLNVPSSSAGCKGRERLDFGTRLVLGHDTGRDSVKEERGD